MSRTKERRKAIVRRIDEMANETSVPIAVRCNELRHVARACQAAWGRLCPEAVDDYGVWEVESSAD